jgi:signal-transduction protein with cAMP-binding, CBS, and nucleotidyltransferase domain
LITYISVEEWKKDEFIIKKDDPVVHMYIVLKGRIHISAFPPSEAHKVCYHIEIMSVELAYRN